MRSQKPEGTTAAHREPYTRREPLRRPRLAAARYFAATSRCVQRTLLQPGANVATTAVPRLVARSFAGCPHARALGRTPRAAPALRALDTLTSRARHSAAASAHRLTPKLSGQKSGTHNV
jgi:hypothetical protein